MEPPLLEAFQRTLALLDYAGVALFALTGALAAAERKQTIVTFAFFAVLTGLGGGTTRDLLIGVPVFWVANDLYLIVCLVAAALVWMTATSVWPHRLLVWLDAVGLASYGVLGAAKALAAGVSPLVAIVMGVFTASVGGIMRDVLAHQPSMVLGHEIYITAAVVAASTYVIAVGQGAPPLAAGIVAALAGFAIRAGAIAYGWKLPGYRRNA